MSVETTSAAPTSAPGSIGAEISTLSSIGPSTGPEFSQSLFNIPGPEIPSSIITEFSRPVGLETESIPEPLVGDFEIHDITAKPFEDKSFSDSFKTQVEPAIFVNPKIIEEISAPLGMSKDEATPVVEPTIFTWDPSVQTQEILKETETQFVEPEQVITDITEDFPRPTLVNPSVDQEIGNLLETNILDSGSIEPQAIETEIETVNMSQDFAELESQLDYTELEKTLAFLQSANFTQEEEAQWKQRLIRLANSTQKITTPIEKEMAKVQLEEQTESEVITEVHAATANSSQPPNKDTTQNGQFEYEDEPKNIIVDYEPKWEAYHITNEWQDAKDVNKKGSKLQRKSRIVQQKTKIQSFESRQKFINSISRT